MFFRIIFKWPHKKQKYSQCCFSACLLYLSFVFCMNKSSINVTVRLLLLRSGRCRSQSQKKTSKKLKTTSWNLQQGKWSWVNVKILLISVTYKVLSRQADGVKWQWQKVGGPTCCRAAAKFFVPCSLVVEYHLIISIRYLSTNHNNERRGLNSGWRGLRVWWGAVLARPLKVCKVHHTSLTDKVQGVPEKSARWCSKAYNWSVEAAIGNSRGSLKIFSGLK